LSARKQESHDLQAFPRFNLERFKSSFRTIQT
jgi:hypothetical protein